MKMEKKHLIGRTQHSALLKSNFTWSSKQAAFKNAIEFAGLEKWSD